MTERISLENGSVTAEIAVMGAELRSLKHGPREVLWQADPAFWGQSSPLLFPICGRAIDNRVSVDGVDYPMTIHGFAMESRFTLVESTPDSCTFALVADETSRRLYPFAFRLEQSYRLEADRLDCRTRVENTGTRPMPFSFGYHPGFALPLPGVAGAHEVRLLNGAAPAPAEQRENFLTGGQIATPFEAGRLEIRDETFFPSSSIILARGAGEGLFYGSGDRGLVIRWQGLENLVLWRPQQAGFLCVEPWQGLPGQIGAGPELAARPFSLTLAQGETREFGLSVDMAAL
ncbi:aldose 1-epimerase family protein [Gemmobacter sp. 24YEA27]|uniref:aldose epimerase family protein n=1 Tax=Gemmobacter sp. 24YEA27 TaxID=3040672 RepID=UPI0024B38F36|nr:aldose 1-epimerase family protein [Gemmobacter sp. 24YEA27]